MTASPLELVTLGIAVLGAVLGVLTTWRTFYVDRPRLRVVESMAMGAGGALALMVTVVNLSSFPLTVDRVGFFMRGTRRHLQLPRPLLVDGGDLPKRLEARASFAVLVPVLDFEEELVGVLSCAYVGTACGLTVTGSGRAVRELVKLATAKQGGPGL